MNSAGAVLQARFGQRNADRDRILKSRSVSSIEVNASNTSISIELPAAVDALIDNKAYYPKFRKLMREHEREVLALVEIAATKDRPSHWFAKATAKANWDRTVTFLAKLARVQALATRVSSKIGSEVSRFVYKQIWSGANVERWADVAREVAHDKPGQSRAKHFAWLCRQELAAGA